MNISSKQQQRNTRVEPMGISRVRGLKRMGIPNEGTMLIKYACKDMGLNCYFMVKGETLEEVTKKALEHVREKHLNEFNNIDSPEEIKKMEEALAHSTRIVEG